jgi:hypothetical protein
MTFRTFLIAFSFLSGHTAERTWVCFFRSPAAQALDQIPRRGVLPRATAAEPPNRAGDQIPQFAVGNSHFP